MADSPSASTPGSVGDDGWPNPRDGQEQAGLRVRRREAFGPAVGPGWGMGLQTEDEAYLSTLESKLNALHTKPTASSSSSVQPRRVTHPSLSDATSSSSRMVVGCSTSPGGSIGSMEDGDEDSALYQGMPVPERSRESGADRHRDLSDVAYRDSEDREVNDNYGAASGLEDEGDPGYPLLTSQDERNGMSSGPRPDTTVDLHSPIQPGGSSSSPMLQTEALPSSIRSQVINDSDPHRVAQQLSYFPKTSPPQRDRHAPTSQMPPPHPPRDDSSSSPSPMRSPARRSPSGPDSRRTLSPVDSRSRAQRSPTRSPGSDSRTMASIRRSGSSPGDVNSAPPHGTIQDGHPSSPCPSKPAKHINFAPRVRITSGIRLPPNLNDSPSGSRSPSVTMSRVPSTSKLGPLPQADPSHPRPIRTNTFTWNPLPDFGFGGRSLETASLASSVSVSLRTVPVNTWLFPNSIARAFLGRSGANGSGGEGAVAPPMESGSQGPGLSVSSLPAEDDLAGDYFSVHPRATEAGPSRTPRSVGTPGSGAGTPGPITTPEMDMIETASSRRSSLSLLSRTSLLLHHTQEEELVEAEAARRRADVMLFNTPYMRSYSSMIGEEEAVSPGGELGGAGTSSPRHRRKHTIIKIKSEEDVIWGEDRWTKWKNWKWWVWKGGRWWRAFENFWCAVDEDEDEEGWNR